MDALRGWVVVETLRDGRRIYYSRDDQIMIMNKRDATVLVRIGRGQSDEPIAYAPSLRRRGSMRFFTVHCKAVRVVSIVAEPWPHEVPPESFLLGGLVADPEKVADEREPRPVLAVVPHRAFPRRAPVRREVVPDEMIEVRPVPGRPVPPEDVDLIRLLRADGLTIRYIARMTGHSHSTVSRLSRATSPGGV
jgi:hypothetical protein